MKKLISIAVLTILTACTAPQEASTIGNGVATYDMNTVQNYNARVISGNTVSARENDFNRHPYQPDCATLCSS